MPIVIGNSVFSVVVVVVIVKNSKGFIVCILQTIRPFIVASVCSVNIKRESVNETVGFYHFYSDIITLFAPFTITSHSYYTTHILMIYQLLAECSPEPPSTNLIMTN